MATAGSSAIRMKNSNKKPCPS